MQAAYHHALVALRRASSVVLCAHVRPDGDAMGSVLALTLALRDNGIPAVPTLAHGATPPSTYKFLPGFSLFVPAHDLEAPQVFIALDTPVIDRLGDAGKLAKAAETVIIIDHHPDTDEFGSVVVHEPDAAATGQIVWNLIKVLDTPPRTEVAQCCYAGLVTDTGRFCYDNTTAAALHAAAEMVEAGVDPAEMAVRIYQSRSAASLAIENRAMSRLTITNGGRVAYAWVDDADFAEIGALPEEAESLPDAVRVVEGVDVAILLRQAGGEVRGNLRSKAGFNVSEVAKHFGGGGHRAASGFTFSGTIDELLPQLLALMPGGDAA
ncbi:MAG: bifunctional oligoribonuclease/PAP phosphatase NrnA [Coriobacteriia bacterium]|nr:bifunctional oligoribonuclease/PAP phosphatase NrnA [Coriobacteriia bacterium]